MAKDDRRSCSVSNQGCTAPAGIGIPGGGGWGDGYGSARATCAVCGEAVCGQCSKLITRKGNRKRVCEYCLDQ